MGSTGVYPQSDGSLTIVGIDSSKGFVDLWVHFFLAMEDFIEIVINRNSYFRVSTKFKHV